MLLRRNGLKKAVRSAAHWLFGQHFLCTGMAATIRLCLLTLPLRPISDESCSILPTYVSENGWICIADIFVAGNPLYLQTLTWKMQVSRFSRHLAHDTILSPGTPNYRWQCFHSDSLHPYWGLMTFCWEMSRKLGQAIWYRISLRVKNIILGGQIYLHAVRLRQHTSNHCCCASSSLRYDMRLRDDEKFHGFSVMLVIRRLPECFVKVSAGITEAKIQNTEMSSKWQWYAVTAWKVYQNASLGILDRLKCLRNMFGAGVGDAGTNR